MQSLKAKIAWRVLGLFCVLVLLGLAALARAGGEDALKDPIALGAWLYQGNCVSCHNTYDNSRLAEDYDDEEELADAIAQGGCEVDWARQYGGKLRPHQIEGLAKFMLAWEELDRQPDLPKLPPQPTVEIETADKKKQGYVLPEEEKVELAPVLKELMEQNPAVHGAWLYVQNCYRCHLDYKTARMGRGVSLDSLTNTITNGKTSTQMLAFSKMQGGNLSNKEIKDITSYIVTWEKYQEPLAISSQVLTPPADDPAALKPVTLPHFARVEGDAQAGHRIYRNNCLRCHGAMGEGYIGPRLAKTWFSLRPDLTIKSIVKGGVPGSAMPAWSQGAGGSLAAKDIADVTVLLESWSGGGPPRPVLAGMR